jgi:hypothetical protein
MTQSSQLDRPAKRAAPVSLGRGHKLLVAMVGVGLWASGGLWLIYHYFLRTIGEWGPEPNALEPWWLKLHGLFAFLALWTLGLLWGVHIVKAWNTGRRRWSGPILLAWITAQAVTGYLLLYAGDDGVWGLVSPTHWIAGLALPAVYGIHRLLFRFTRSEA